ncbi:MAG: hypothetical protein J6N81_07675 [Treponema sp.]|nr:hypothetical protein [Treponema sp.]MBP3280742.1 hypothetical protein [Treponema sp.]MBP3283855.1 hypothetical protein [Treponema sp.]
MTREERQQIKEKEKEYKELIKQVGKKFGMGHKQCDLFFVHKEYFVDILYDFHVEQNNIMYSATIKYLDYDDILWDILDMPDNKNEPLSLRAYGAFSAYGLKLVPPYKFVSLGDNPEYVISKTLSDVKQMVENFDEVLDERILLELRTRPHPTKEFIVYIHQKQYAKARKLAEDCIKNGEEGTFGNNGKDFFELALEYLNKNNL